MFRRACSSTAHASSPGGLWHGRHAAELSSSSWRLNMTHACYCPFPADCRTVCVATLHIIPSVIESSQTIQYAHAAIEQCHLPAPPAECITAINLAVHALIPHATACAAAPACADVDALVHRAATVPRVETHSSLLPLLVYVLFRPRRRWSLRGVLQSPVPAWAPSAAASMQKVRQT